MLENVNITGRNRVGAIAGYTDFTGFSKCFVSGIITGKNEIGGFIGSCNGIYILNSCSTTNVNGLNQVGGLIGKSACLPYTYVYKSYSIGNVTGSENTGGLIGQSENPNFVFSYWDTETSGQLISAGGEGRTTYEMTYDYSSDTYKYWDFAGMWVEDFGNINGGYPFLQNRLSKLSTGAPSNLTSSCQNNSFTVELSWNNPDTLLNGDPITELTAVHVYRNFNLLYTINSPLPGNSESYTDIVAQTGNYTYKVIGVNSEGYGINARINQPAGNLFAGGNCIESDPYLISNAEQLNNIRYYTGKDSVCFKQTETIDLGVAPWNDGKGWIPIGHDESEFNGSFEGNTRYCTIDNLTINDSTRYYASLFGVIRNAEIDDIHFNNVNISGNASCGSLSGVSLNSKITNCSADFGIVSGIENEIGGLIGAAIDDSISCCFTNIEVSGNIGIGGLIGYTDMNTSIKDCYSIGKVDGNETVGGLIGANFSETPIINCYSTGSVTGVSYVGGFAGITFAYPINSYWDIETSGQLTSYGGEGRMTYEMVYPTYSDSTYVNWDFENIWIQGCPTKSMYPILRWQTLVSIEEDYSIPVSSKLYQNYPNPFNPDTHIKFELSRTCEAKLNVYNVAGQQVAELANGRLSAGNHTIEFDGSKLNSGIYYYNLEADGKSLVKKMIMLK